MTDADDWEYCYRAYDDPPGEGWEMLRTLAHTLTYRRLRYPRFAELADIPITPGRVEWSFCGTKQDRRVWGQSSAGGFLALLTSPEHRNRETVGQVIHDFANALATESDEAWLRKRGHFFREELGGAMTDFFRHDDGHLFSPCVDGYPQWCAALRRAVEAIEEGGDGGLLHDRCHNEAGGCRPARSFRARQTPDDEGAE